MRFRIPGLAFFRGLAFRYSLFFLISILVILFIPLLIGYGTSSAFLIYHAKIEAENETRQTISAFENVVRPIELLPKTLAQAIENPKINITEVMRVAMDFVSRDSMVFGTCLAFEPFMGLPDAYWYAPYAYESKEGVRRKYLGSEQYDYFKMDWYRLPKLLNKSIWTEPYFDHGGGDTLMCTYSTPVYREVDGQRRFIGVLTMDVSLTGFSRIIESIKLFQTGYGILVTREGQILASQQSTLKGENALRLARESTGEGTRSAIIDMLNGGTGFRMMDGMHAKEYPGFLSYSKVGETGWSIGIWFPENELYADLFKFLKIMAWIFGISIFLLLLTTIFITRRMTRPIVKLVDATRQIGHGDFEAILPVRKSRDEIAQLTRAFALMQEELRNYINTLEATTTAKEKIESELKVAHQIQMGMLPRGFHMPSNWDLFATVDPAKAVGGDLYDFFYLDDDHLCIAIGDVAGKGVPASLFMMVTRTLFRAKASSKLPLRQLMLSLNEELCRENPNEMFVTFFAGVVNLTTGKMEFCNAGHNYPYLVSQTQGTRQLKVRNGLPLGIFIDTDYTTGFYQFQPNEIMVITTDGITDAINKENDFFGEAHLASSLAKLASKDSKSLTELLIAEVKRFSSGTEQADDITILSLQYKDNYLTSQHE